VGILGACGEDYCQTERRLLIEQARGTAGRQGHILGEFVKVKDYAIWQARCERCEYLVAINLNPAPGELDICGEPVTDACPGFEGQLPESPQDEEQAPWFTQLQPEDT